MLRAPLFVSLTFFCAGCAGPGDRSVALYGGRFVDDSLPNDLLLFRELDPLDSFITTLAYSEVFYKSPSENFRWEWEGNFTQHSGLQSHQEFNALFIFRWLRFPWNETLRTSFAIGDGLSYAAETPDLEAELQLNDGGTNQLLNFLILELTFAHPSWKHWSLLGRVHHRSGIFGVFDGVDGGSNILALGVRYSF